MSTGYSTYRRFVVVLHDVDWMFNFPEISCWRAVDSLKSLFGVCEWIMLCTRCRLFLYCQGDSCGHVWSGEIIFVLLVWSCFLFL